MKKVSKEYWVSDEHHKHMSEGTCEDILLVSRQGGVYSNKISVMVEAKPRKVTINEVCFDSLHAELVGIVKYLEGERNTSIELLKTKIFGADHE